MGKIVLLYAALLLAASLNYGETKDLSGGKENMKTSPEANDAQMSHELQDGPLTDVGKLSEWIRNLPMRDLDAMRSALQTNTALPVYYDRKGGRINYSFGSEGPLTHQPSSPAPPPPTPPLELSYERSLLPPQISYKPPPPPPPPSLTFHEVPLLPPQPPPPRKSYETPPLPPHVPYKQPQPPPPPARPPSLKSHEVPLLPPQPPPPPRKSYETTTLPLRVPYKQPQPPPPPPPPTSLKSHEVPLLPPQPPLSTKSYEAPLLPPQAPYIPTPRHPPLKSYEENFLPAQVQVPYKSTESPLPEPYKPPTPYTYTPSPPPTPPLPPSTPIPKPTKAYISSSPTTLLPNNPSTITLLLIDTPSGFIAEPLAPAQPALPSDSDPIISPGAYIKSWEDYKARVQAFNTEREAIVREYNAFLEREGKSGEAGASKRDGRSGASPNLLSKYLDRLNEIEEDQLRTERSNKDVWDMYVDRMMGQGVEAPY